VVGLVETVLPSAEPQLPFTTGVDLFAEQDLFVPLFIPLHVHVQGPEPFTEDALPARQRFVVGFAGTLLPFAEPQLPSTF
jgi:hypothetical protein